MKPDQKEQSNISQQIQSDSTSHDGEYILKFSQTIQIKHSAYIQKALLYPTYNQTFLLSFNNWLSHLCHYNKQGTLIKKFPLIKDGLIHKVHMISDHKVIIQYSQMNKQIFCILQWNIKTNETIQLNCLSSQNSKISESLMVFPETKTFCVIEIITAVWVKIKYYSYPLLSQNTQPINQLKIKMSQQINKYIIQQVNHHSGIIFKKRSEHQRQDDYLFGIYDLRNQEKQIKWHKFDHSSLQNKDKRFYLKFIEIWQPTQGFIYLKYKVALKRSLINNELQKQKDMAQVYKKVNQYIQKQKSIHFLWDYNKKALIYLNISQQKDSVIQFSNGLRTVQTIASHQAVQNWLVSSVPRKPIPLRFLELPIYYIRPKDWSIVACQKPSQRYINYDTMKYEGVTFLEYDNTVFKSYKLKPSSQGTIKINIQTVKLRQLPYSLKIISNFMLNQIIDNCEQDLQLAVSNLI